MAEIRTMQSPSIYRKTGVAIAALSITLFGIGAVSASACAAATKLTEKASPTSGGVPQAVTFTYYETNTGQVTLKKVAVAGSLAGNATYQSGDQGNGKLDPGETWVFTATKTFTVAGTYTDNATAKGSGVDGSPAPAEHAAATIHFTPTPVVSTTLTESANPSSGIVPQTVMFTYSEHNSGTVALDHVSVTGDLAGAATYKSGDSGTGKLDPGETWIFIASRTFIVAGEYTDHATAIGSMPSGEKAPSEQAGVTVHFDAKPVVHTTLTQSANPGSGVAPQTVTFTYNEKNDGTDPLTNIAISSSLAGEATYRSGDTNHYGTLNPGETWIFTANITLSAAGYYTDRASATGTAVDGQAVAAEQAGAGVQLTAPATAAVPVPSLTLPFTG